MSYFRWYVIPVIVALMTAEVAAQIERKVEIGYVFPAGGQQGSTFEAVIAAQHLSGLSGAHVSGGRIQAEIVGINRLITIKELQDARAQIAELRAKRAVVRNDRVSLARAWSFNARVKKTDEELEEVKRKYAGARWTTEDAKRLADFEKKTRGGYQVPLTPALCQQAVVRITIDPDAELGRRDLRILTRDGLSNPLAFHVGRLTEYSEEPSDIISKSPTVVDNKPFWPSRPATKPEMTITLPAVVNGQIRAGAVDRVRFRAAQGQQIVIVASARQLIPYVADAVPGWFQATLALYDAQGNELAYCDDYRFSPDPVIQYQIPADGEYVVEIKDAIYRGRESFVYRITVGEVPVVTDIFPLGGPAGKKTTVSLRGWNLPTSSLTFDNTDRMPGIHSVALHQTDWASVAVPFHVDTLPEHLEQEPNARPDVAQQVTLPLIVNGRIDQPDDTDVFAFEGRAGAEIVAEVLARRLNSPLDSVLTLTDATGKRLALNHDHEDKAAGLITHQADSWLHATLPVDGTYFIYLRDGQHKGGPEYGYRLRISSPRPDFELRVVPSAVNFGSGTTVPLTVYAIRRDGFDGEIVLQLKDAPEGVVLSGGKLPPGQEQVEFTLTAPSAPIAKPLSLQIEGRARIEGQDITRQAVPAEDRTQAFVTHHLVPAEELAVFVSRFGGGRAARFKGRKQRKNQ